MQKMFLSLGGLQKNNENSKTVQRKFTGQTMSARSFQNSSNSCSQGGEVDLELPYQDKSNNSYQYDDEDDSDDGNYSSSNSDDYLFFERKTAMRLDD